MAHAKADKPFRGPDRGWQMATVLDEEREGETVVIMVEFADGWCIVDPGDGSPMEIIHIDNLREWSEVTTVEEQKEAAEREEN